MFIATPLDVDPDRSGRERNPAMLTDRAHEGSLSGGVRDHSVDTRIDALRPSPRKKNFTSEARR